MLPQDSKDFSLQLFQFVHRVYHKMRNMYLSSKVQIYWWYLLWNSVLSIGLLKRLLINKRQTMSSKIKFLLWKWNVSNLSRKCLLVQWAAEVWISDVCPLTDCSRVTNASITYNSNVYRTHSTSNRTRFQYVKDYVRCLCR